MYGEETAGRQYVKKKITQPEPEYDKNTDRHRRTSTQVKWGGRDGRREPDSGLGYTQDWNPQRWTADFGGNMGCWVQCRRAHGQFDIHVVCRWERTVYCMTSKPQIYVATCLI